MAETISMPKLGFDMQEGTLVRWVKNEGETVNKGDVLAEIETDKATVEVESSASGVVRKLLVNEGTVVPVSTPIAIVGTADEKIEAPAGQPAASQPKAAPSAPTQQPGQKAESQPATEKQEVQAPVPVPAQPATEAPQGMLKASPLARRMAR